MSNVIDDFLAIVAEASVRKNLTESSIAETHPTFYLEALEKYETWENMLLQVIWTMFDGSEEAEKLLVEKQLKENSTSSSAEQERVRSPEADEPVFILTEKGEICVQDGAGIPLSEDAWTPEFPEGWGNVSMMRHEGADLEMTVFSQKGNYFGIMNGLIPSLDSLGSARSLSSWLELERGERLFWCCARHHFLRQNGRLYHVTRTGKGKATGLEEYSQLSGKKGTQAFLLNEGDEPVSIMIGDEWDGMFCASSMGQGIHFATESLRSMGRKSVGVQFMKLGGGEDEVVSAFLTKDVYEIAVISTLGYGKRLSIHEFRQQGRGGSGMQVLRTGPTDRVVAVVPCSLNSDVAITTSAGNVYRFPSTSFPKMGRSARGKRILEVSGEETITGMHILPCGGGADDSYVKETSEEQPYYPDEVVKSYGGSSRSYESPSEREEEEEEPKVERDYKPFF